MGIAEFMQVPVTPEELSQADGQFSPELLAKYAPLKLQGDLLLDNGGTQLQTLSLAASRDWLETDHGPIATGLGWDWRQEKVDYQALNPNRPSFSGQRQNWSVYSEVQAPLNDQHDVSLALRHDQYSDFGGVQTGKLGWRWRPQKGLMFRSSVGTGFRAPTLSQMQAISTEIYELTDLQTKKNLVVRNAGNPNLKPEQSRQASLGFRWEPSPRWTVGADFWQLHIHNTFGVYATQDVLDSLALRDQYITTENGTTYLNLPNLNLGQSRRQGVDYDLQWREPTDWGRFRLTWRGTWNLQAQKQSVNQGSFESELGIYASNTERSTPRHQ
jgi:iron complex outermembrane receptor protein